MKRKDFLKSTAILSLAPIISQAKVFENKPKTDVSPEMALIGVGKQGAQLAVKSFLALAPAANIHLYTIDENYRPNGSVFTNIWYRRVFSKHHNRIPEEMQQDWEHNYEALQPVLNLSQKKIVVTSALGGETGTYLSYTLIKKLLEHKQKEDITFIASFPFMLEGPRREWFSNKYLEMIKQLGVQTKVIKLEDLREKVNNLSIDFAFAYADRLMAEKIGSAVKDLSFKNI
jgi:hypothetical protein